MSKKKQAGKLKQHVTPVGKRLGLKVTHGEKVKIGSILIRQRGTRYAGGQGVKTGRDHTLYAITDGVVQFGKKQSKSVVNIIAK